MDSVDALVVPVLAGFVALAALLDLRARRIPNWLVLAGLAAAFGLRLALDSPWALLSLWLGGLACGFFLFLPLYLLRGMAAGDVKLMAMVGAFVGPAAALGIGAASVCIGGALALAIALAKGRLVEMLGNSWRIARFLMLRGAGMPLRPDPQTTRSIGAMPYGVAIAAGTLLMLWLERR